MFQFEPLVPVSYTHLDVYKRQAATLLYQQGGVDIRVLQQMLGHVNLGTTEIYTHTSSQQLKEAAESSPLKNVRPSHIAKDDKK